MCDWIYTNLFWLAPTISSIVLTVFIIRVSAKQKNLQKEQNEIQKQNVKLALFDKRLKIYTRVREFIAMVISDSSCTMKDVNDFHHDCREAILLFEDDVYYYVDELRKKGKSLSLLKSKENKSLVDKEFIKRSEIIDKQEVIIDWFTQQLSESVEIFDRYLNVNKLGL